MPYIAPSHRKELDVLIDELAHRLISRAQEAHYDGAFAGLLNYTCTRLALKIVQRQFGEMRYWLIAILTGTFHNIADEFYRRLGVPYENQQIAKHGDVDLYAEYAQKIEKLS
jgi:hypothetical protein